MKKVDVRVKRTYQQLIDAVMKLLTERDFDSLSVSDICDKAGIHRATFYKHFNDKLEFVNYCFQSKLATIDFNAFLEDPTPENIKEAMMSFIEEIFRFADKNMLLLSAVYSKKYYASLGSVFVSTLSKFCCENFSSVITAPKYQVEIMATFYANALTGVISLYVENNGNYPKDDIFKFLEHRIDELMTYYEKNLYVGNKAYLS